MSNQNYPGGSYRYGTPSGSVRWQDAANLLLAAWFFISPWLLQFGSSVSTAQPAAGGAAVIAVSNAAWDAWILSVIVFLVALSALGRLARGQEVTNMLLGAWIFVAPWVLGFAGGPYPAAAWDHWIVGTLVFLISASRLSYSRPSEREPAWQHEPSRR